MTPGDAKEALWNPGLGISVHLESKKIGDQNVNNLKKMFKYISQTAGKENQKHIVDAGVAE